MRNGTFSREKIWVTGNIESDGSRSPSFLLQGAGASMDFPLLSEFLTLLAFIYTYGP